MNGQQFLAFALLIKRKYDLNCKPVLLEFDLRQSDLDVLMFLAANPTCRTAREISESRLLSKSLVSSAVDTLMRKGLLTGEVDPSDRRRVLLTLLPPAREIIDRTLAVTEQSFQQSLSGVAEADLRAVERVSMQICHNLEEAGCDGARA